MDKTAKVNSCPNCDGDLLDSDDQRFCQHCGENLKACRECENILPEEPCKYCPNCGTER